MCYNVAVMLRNINFSRIAFWIGLGLVFYVFILLIGEGTKSYKLHNKADEITAEIDQLKADSQVLEYKIAYYTTDLYKERLAREKLGLQQPGESVVIVRGSKPNSALPKVQLGQVSQPVPTSNFQAWLEFLFGKQRS